MEGKGIVIVNTKYGKKIINDMIFNPSLNQNLIIIEQLMRK